MKNMLKTVAIISSAALIGTGVYIISNDNIRKKASKKITNAMDDMEQLVNKKMNYNK